MFSIFDMYYDQPCVNKTENGYKVTVPAMGYTREECEVYTQNNKIFIKLNNEKRGKQEYSYILPKEADIDNIKAKLELGEFIIEIPLLKYERKNITVE